MPNSIERNPNLLVAVGASAGGLNEIVTIVEELPTWFEGTLLIANHRTPGNRNTLAEILAHRARVRVDEPVDDEWIECTRIYVGKSDQTVEVDGREFDVTRNSSSHARTHRIDDLFESVARSAGENSVGIILSGMLSDGVAGLKAIKEAGGYCMIQCPEEAKFPDMPNNAIDQVNADFVGTTREISSRLMELALGKRCQE